MITLGDAPGGAKLIESLTNAMKDFSLLYAYTDDDSARSHLQSYIESIEPGITEAVGAGTAKIILEAFFSAVMNEKHKIEAQGASRA